MIDILNRVRNKELQAKIVTAEEAAAYIKPGMGTRGSLGGLSHKTADAVKALDAFGKDIIFVETVGVGQSEVDIVKAADTTMMQAGQSLLPLQKIEPVADIINSLVQEARQTLQQAVTLKI